MRRKSLYVHSCLAVLLFSTLPSFAHAQAYERIAPHQPPARPAPLLVVPAQEAMPVGGSQAVLVPELKGVVFLDNSQSVVLNGAPDNQAGVHQQGLSSLSTPEFTDKISKFLGRPLTMALLNEIWWITQDWYRTHGRPFLSVSIPPQNISNGIVQVVVIQYKVGNVRVAGNRWFSSGLIKRESGLNSGQTLDLAKVKADMSWLNANDFRTIDAVFAPGTKQGTTDITLQTKDHFPLYVYGTYDNQGVPNLGRGEWGVGAVWGNAFNRGQILSYQFTRNVTGRYNAHSANWTIPLPWRDKIMVFGSYATERPNLGAEEEYFNEKGHSGQASLRYIHNLPLVQLSRDVSLTTDVQAGYDFKATNNDLEFGGTKIFNGNAEINQFPLILDATEIDSYGQTVFQNELDLSPGDLTGSNNNTAFKNLVPGASASYYVNQIGLTRTTFLPGNFSWTSRILGQFTNHNQMYSNQLALGGIYSVRGYDTDTVTGSEGVITQNEIRAPAFSLIELMQLTSDMMARDTEQLGVFFDYGHVSQIQPIFGTANEADLSSFGLDIHTTLGRYVTLAWDVGWRLRDAPTNGGKDRAFADVSMSIGF